MRQTVNLFIVAMCVAVPAMAQDFQQTPQVAPPAAPARVASTPTPIPQRMAPTMVPPQVGQRATTPTPQAAEAPAAPQRQVDPRIDPSDVNIKLMVTITDKSSSATLTKIVTVIMANRGNGRVRSQGSTLAKDQVLAGGTLQGTMTNRSSELNVDARATLLKNGSISTDLTINYTPEWTDEASKMTSVSQSVSLYLKDGAPTIITQAADPTKGSRSVTIEVTASVMK